MNVRPLFDRVLIQRDSAEEKKGLLFIPDVAKSVPNIGTVLAVGKGALVDGESALRPLEVKVGDRVMFGKWSGTEVVDLGKDILMMKEGEILGILESE